jgi:hypothetical protein
MTVTKIDKIKMKPKIPVIWRLDMPLIKSTFESAAINIPQIMLPIALNSPVFESVVPRYAATNACIRKSIPLTTGDEP